MSIFARAILKECGGGIKEWNADDIQRKFFEGAQTAKWTRVADTLT
jgi:hypothetical protein